MLKLLDGGHRDKATKEIPPFRTVLQIAKNFEQCEKAKAVMRQAKGPTEQVNYAGVSRPPKSDQNWSKGHFSQSKSEKEWGQSQSSCQVKFNIYQLSIVQGHHTLAQYAQCKTSDALERAVRESDTLL